MRPPPKSAIFLERASYRQRRLRDAARLLPVLGIILWAIPLLWPHQLPEGSDRANAVIYVFGVWVLVIVLTALVSRALRPDPDTATKDPTA